MEAGEVRQLITILVVSGDLLTDVAAAGPRIGLPAGLWRPIADSLADAGSPRRILAFEDPYDQMMMDNGVPHIRATSAPLAGLEHAVSDILRKGAGPNTSDFDVAAERHGLRGASLAMKAQVVQVAFEDYAAHGRVTEIPKDRQSWTRRAFAKLGKALGPCSTVVDSASSLPQMGYLKLVGEGMEMVQHAIGLARGQIR
jgi:hypothetical protein